jgi:magnesium transporter
MAEQGMEQGGGLDAKLGKLDPRSAAERLRDRDDSTIASLLATLHIGHAVEILEEFPPERRERIAAATAFGQGQLWLQGHAYPEGTVGRLMERPPAVFAPVAMVAEVVDALREIVKQRMVTYIFVTEADGRLVGVVAFRELVFADPAQRLADIMLRDPFSLRPEQPLVDAMREVVKRHYPVYPVCDAAGRLLGLVKGQSLFEQQAFEISAQAGAMVGVEKEERLATPWTRSFRFRHPWLLINLLTVFAAAAVVGFFQDTIDRIVVLAAFLPVLAGQCGNLGAQSLAVTIRGMTLGELRGVSMTRLLAKETWLGLLNGLVTGTLAGIGMYFAAHVTDNRLGLAVVTMAAMALACMLSGLAGVVIPVAMRRFGADPATASSIFLTTVTDISSMFFFLAFATWLLPH